MDSAMDSRTLAVREWIELRAQLAQLWQVMVRYVVLYRPDRDDPVVAHINSWHSTPWLDNVAPGDRIAAIKGPLGMLWMDDRRILEYTTGHDFTNKLPIMFSERQQREDMYFDLHTCCFVCVGHVAHSHGHFPAAPVSRWRRGIRYYCTTRCTPQSGVRRVKSSGPTYYWTTAFGHYCVLISLVSARDGLRILRGMRTLQRIYLYKLARKAIRPFAVASSKACDVASIGTVRNVIYGFLRGSNKPCNERSAKKAKRRKLSARPGNEHD